MNKILIHICCSVDSIYSIKKIKALYPNQDIIGFFYNPNIQPYSEYLIRKIDTEYICKINNINFIEGKYDYKEWYKATSKFEKSHEKGERCKICHSNVLEKTAIIAKKLNIDNFTTTLYMSPLKSNKYLSNIGNDISKKYNINFLEIDLKKDDGTLKTLNLVNKYQIYRQDYCGCFFGALKHKQEDWIFDFSSPIKDKLSPGSKEFLNFLYKLRFDLFKQKIDTKIKKYTFINWRITKSILKINEDIVHDYTVIPYSKSTNGIFKSIILKIKNENIILKKDGINILDKNSNFKRSNFNTDIVIKLGNNLKLSEKDKISFQLKTIFNPSFNNYYLTIGTKTNQEEKEINVYNDKIFNKKDININKYSYKIYSEFI